MLGDDPMLTGMIQVMRCIVLYCIQFLYCIDSYMHRARQFLFQRALLSQMQPTSIAASRTHHVVIVLNACTSTCPTPQHDTRPHTHSRADLLLITASSQCTCTQLRHCAPGESTPYMGMANTSVQYTLPPIPKALEAPMCTHPPRMFVRCAVLFIHSSNTVCAVVFQNGPTATCWLAPRGGYPARFTRSPMVEPSLL